MANLFFEPTYLKHIFPALHQAASSVRYILIAEQDDSNFLYFQVISRKLNIVLLRATDGLQAIEAVKTNPAISMVLMNIRIPKVDGYEATAEIRRINPGIPIIAINSSAFPESFYKALQVGCCDYLSKPVYPSEYKEMIQLWCH
ncbi:MAG TPA: response regulator [Lentimicrobium sp.]|nr:response regulator [Lentimicrobium sp.]